VFEAYTQWGCGHIDLWNVLRTSQYVNRARLGDPGAYIDPACVPSGLSTLLGNPTYTTPANDGAWWYDENRPESSGFAGMLPVTVEGMYSGTYVGTTTTTIGRSGRVAILAGREVARTITIEADLYGVSCCSTAYGFRVVTQALRGCCIDPCCGQPMRTPAYMLGTEDPCQGFTPVGSLLTEPTPWRTLFGLGLIEGPEVIEGVGPRCGACGCWPQTTIRFVLAAANPTLYTDATVITPSPVILSDPLSPILCNICQEDATTCPDPEAQLVDPLCIGLPAPPAVPDTLIPNCFCAPIGFRRRCFEIDSGNARWFEALLNATIKTGAGALRNLRVRMWQKIGNNAMDSGLYTACNACTGFQLGYVPGGSKVTIDSRTGSVDVRVGGQSYNGSGQVFTIDGLPWDGSLRMACGKYLVCVDTDPYSTADDATIELSTVEAEP
jgi:hypothetical protein